LAKKLYLSRSIELC